MFIVEYRTIHLGPHKDQFSFESDYVYLASTLARAEDWMQNQDPGFHERYCYAVIKAAIDSNEPFQVVHYYDILGQQTTKQRCIDSLR